MTIPRYKTGDAFNLLIIQIKVDNIFGRLDSSQLIVIIVFAINTRALSTYSIYQLFFPVAINLCSLNCLNLFYYLLVMPKKTMMITIYYTSHLVMG